MRNMHRMGYNDVYGDYHTTVFPIPNDFLVVLEHCHRLDSTRTIGSSIYPLLQRVQSYWGCGKQLESAPKLKPLCEKTDLCIYTLGTIRPLEQWTIEPVMSTFT